MTSVFRTFEGHDKYISEKMDLIALLFIKLYYNENIEIDFLEMASWRMCPFSIKCLNFMRVHMRLEFMKSA